MAKLRIRKELREKLEVVLKDLPGGDLARARAAIGQLGEPELRDALVACVRWALGGRQDRAESIVASTLGSLLENKPVNESEPDGPKRLDTFDASNPLPALVRVLDKRIKRVLREKGPAQFSVVEGNLSGPLDGVRELPKLLSNGEYADSDEEFPLAILIMQETTAAVAEVVRGFDEELQDLVTKRWLADTPVLWKEISVAERRGQRRLDKAREMLMSRLQELGLFDQDEAGGP